METDSPYKIQMVFLVFAGQNTMEGYYRYLWYKTLSFYFFYVAFQRSQFKVNVKS